MHSNTITNTDTSTGTTPQDFKDKNTAAGPAGLRDLIFQLENPQVYTGLELNSVRKEEREDHLRICLVFPDTYEIGMSHYGLKILYHLLNSMEGVIAERCFLPTRNSIAVFQEHGVPLFSLESKRPLADFHLIGFSLLSELTFTNVLQVLDLAGIPLRREQRKQSFPLVAAGGISAVNPEPLREFVDIFACGDGEVLFPRIVEVLEKAQKEGLEKNNTLDLLDAVEGIYVPALAPLEKKGRFFVPTLAPAAGTGDKDKEKVRGKRKAVSRTLAPVSADHHTIVPIANVVFNRLSVEIARGCPQNCRFCQAKSYYSPYRLKSPEDTMEAIDRGLRNTGFDAFSLSSLSAGDYPWLEELMRLIPRVITPGTSFSFPSLRPSAISEYLLATVAQFRRTGITIVPEAGTERLRRVINKNVTDAEIFNAADLAIRHRWQKIKLYFMIGLPTETQEDLDGIVRLIRGIRQRAREARRKISLHASFSSFVPKPHTPLQWAPREDLEAIFQKVNYLKQQLKSDRRLDIDYHSPQKGVVETILARGDVRAGDFLEKAFRKGQIFTAWDGDFHFPVWKELIDETPELREFLSGIDVDETLPWEFLEVNYKPGYLRQEYQKAQSAQSTMACGEMECSRCGGCSFGYKRHEPVSVPPAPAAEAAPSGETAEEAVKPVEFNKIRLYYRKIDDFVFLSHLSMAAYIERIIRRTGILFKCSEGFHPRMKIISLPALPVFASGLMETVEVFLDASFDETAILERLNAVTEAFQFTRVEITPGGRLLSRDIHFIHFEIHVPAERRDPAMAGDIESILSEGDEASWSGDTLFLKMDYAHNGQERFAKVSRRIDPERSYTRHLTRTKITFKLLPPGLPG